MSGYLGYQLKDLEFENLLDEVQDLRNEVETLKSQVIELLSERDNSEEEK
jgi:peptidoglycan hydrolase CwlO-like protein